MKRRKSHDLNMRAIMVFREIGLNSKQSMQNAV